MHYYNEVILKWSQVIEVNHFFLATVEASFPLFSHCFIKLDFLLRDLNCYQSETSTHWGSSWSVGTVGPAPTKNNCQPNPTRASFPFLHIYYSNCTVYFLFSHLCNRWGHARNTFEPVEGLLSGKLSDGCCMAEGQHTPNLNTKRSKCTKQKIKSTFQLHYEITKCQNKRYRSVQCFFTGAQRDTWRDHVWNTSHAVHAVTWKVTFASRHFKWVPEQRSRGY